ncbi:hypothetical protein FOTG_01690 [Fusarium oxysporum f. sp. vasinfectum 25433]|uniref:Uncharacterized protein n=1 Tax=Fusarium oxysporum f. sp. vasinfectum 25433 TaxID=1089449 RepID=X0MAE7_FUSOX|nr:hypothetical protein FOTG_01690 [Fusarium oxysporum f. sp. vasinfectum 25433]
MNGGRLVTNSSNFGRVRQFLRADLQPPRYLQPDRSTIAVPVPMEGGGGDHHALIIPRPSRKISMEKNLVKRRSQGTRLRKTRSHRTITGPRGDRQHHHPASRKIKTWLGFKLPS